MIKNSLLGLLVLAVLVAGFFWFISDRDRGLLVLTTALKATNPIATIDDISFGREDWQKLDVYPQDEVAPVVVFIYGGSWRHGRKDQYRFAADAFHRQGYTVVVPDYLKYPDARAKYPSFAIDGAKALAWVKKNIDQYQGDSDKVFLAGHSAGAHTALMLATDPQFLNAEGLAPNDLSGVIGIAGPYSFIPDWEVTQAVFGPPENYPLMDTLNYVDGNEPPTLLLHSFADQRVERHHQEKLAAALQDKGGDAHTVFYKTLSHTDMVTHLHPWFEKDVSLMADINRFIKKRI